MHARARASSAPGRRAGIDVVRGLAIIVVIFRHPGLRIPRKKTVLVAVLRLRLLSNINDNINDNDNDNDYEAVQRFS